MNYTDILASLSQASAFDLYRLRAAIYHVLDQPDWIAAVQARLRVGMELEYFDAKANRTCKGQLLEIRRKHALILELATRERWIISYASINLDGADVEIREQPKQGLSRQAVAIGDVLGFVDRNQQRSGKVIRLNDKTVTLQVGHQSWRVSYSLLHRIVDASVTNGDIPELGVFEGEAERVMDKDA